MSSKPRFLVGVGIVVLALSGLACSTAGPAGKSGDAIVAREACFDVRKVRGFAQLHEKFVYLQVGSDEHYLLTTERIYPDAERRIPSRPPSSGISITGTDISDHFSRVCRETWAEVDYMNAGAEVHRRIAHIEAVASKEVAQKLVEERIVATPTS